MNLLYLFRRKQIVLRPDPDLRIRRMAQFDSQRRSRAICAIMAVNDRALADRVDAARRERVKAIKG